MSDSGKALVFYAITMGLALLVRLAVPWIGEASLPLTMLTPAIAAVLMLTIIAPEGGARSALSSLGLNRIGFKGWPLAIAGPSIIHGTGLALLAAGGLTALAPLAPDTSGFALVLDILAGFVIGTLLALGEEVGWRGYMLPRLYDAGVVPAMRVVGLLHGIWHLPLMLTTDWTYTTTPETLGS